MPRGYVPLLLLLAALWGASYLFIKVGVRELEPAGRGVEVDVGAEPGAPDPLEAIRVVAAEVARYSEKLATLPRWLVVNKIDLVAPAEREKTVNAIAGGLGWTGPVFAVSAATGEGTKELCRAVVDYLKASPSRGH